VLVTLPVAFGVFFAGVAGPNPASGGSAVLFGYLLPVATPGSVSMIPDRLAGWWLVSVVATARQALALSLDRKKLVDGLCRGMAAMGNDSPFAPLFPSTDPTVAQRDQDLVKARQLMAAAGAAAGFDITLTTEHYTDIPEYAQLVQNFAKPLGIRIALKIETQALYYGKSIPGQSDWLDSALGITDYAHRGAPNTLLGNPLVRQGPWNAAHFNSAAYDAMVLRYVKALDSQAQRSAARDIQELLLDETPLIISYFPDLLVPVRRGVTGLVPIAAGLLLDRVTRS